MTIQNGSLLSSEKSLIGNTCEQIFTTCFGYLRFLYLKHKLDLHLALTEIFLEVGFPTGIHTYNKGGLNLGLWK